MGIAILIGIWLTNGPCDGVPRSGAMPMSPQGLGLATALLTVARRETNVVGLVERVFTWSYLQGYAVTGLRIWRWA